MAQAQFENAGNPMERPGSKGTFERSVMRPYGAATHGSKPGSRNSSTTTRNG